MGSKFNKTEYSNKGIGYTSVAVEEDVSIKVFYNWHPGVPGYSLKLPLEITANNGEIDSEELLISADDSRVLIEKTVLEIPEDVRNSKKELIVTVKYGPVDFEFAIPLKSWERTFNDEFDNGVLNTDVWKMHRNHMTYIPPEDADTYEVIDRAQIAPNCFTVKDNQLHMLITDDEIYDPIAKKKYLFSECCLDTRDYFTQKYGCFSARISCAKFGGLNTAFWLLPLGKYGTKYTNFKSDNPKIGLSEIDILETSAAWGDGNRFCITEHYYDYTNNYAHTMEGEYYNVEDKMTDFHTFTCVWFEDSIYYYVNDKLVRATFNLQADGVEGETMTEAYMIIDVSCYLDNSWVGKRNFTKEDLPISAVVDWVRAYK